MKLWAVKLEHGERFLDILNDAPLAAHRKPTRIYGSIAYCLLLASQTSFAGYAIVGIAAPWIFEPLESWISPLLCSCNVILLLITGIFQQYMAYQVRKIRLQGYYTFSQKLKHIVRLPFATLSYDKGYSSTSYCFGTYCDLELALPLVGRLVMLVEVVIAGSFMAAYIGKLVVRRS
ncbi:hypothetical protein Cgig2_010840 [Carnegiea gigantea]|uniref:Uncharacterized protein n=1 Tax=Carnegiea gigantea TaxID=171969 RepID=A0A9Q1GQ01_9CARY|nr:hypothetical protein Cgig2_010840 [Carnegiea gigantea]